jgi:hypothetical protein
MGLHQFKAWVVKAYQRKLLMLDQLHLLVGSMVDLEVKISPNLVMEKRASSTRRMTLTLNLKVQPLQVPIKWTTQKKALRTLKLTKRKKTKRRKKRKTHLTIVHQILILVIRLKKKSLPKFQRKLKRKKVSTSMKLQRLHDKSEVWLFKGVKFSSKPQLKNKLSHLCKKFRLLKIQINPS